MSGLQLYIAFAGGWLLINGILHDVFVLRQKRKFDKELVRLLVDGHILIFSGIIYLICFQSLTKNFPLAEFICLANSLFVIVYCVLIYRILPSYATIAINIVSFAWIVLSF